MSQSTKLILSLALAGFAFAGSASAQTLAQGEVESLLKGKTIKTRDDGFGGAGTITWNADGTIAIDLTKTSDKSKQVDTGTYRFANGGYCSTWKVLRTTEKCFTLKRASATEVQIINPDGTLDSVLNP